MENYIDTEVTISVGSINTIKENVPVCPLIECYAQPVIKAMLDLITRKDEKTKRENVDIQTLEGRLKLRFRKPLGLGFC